MEVLIKDLGLLINAILIATPPLLLAALGSCFSERSGVINIGIEGMMTIGAFIGACVAYFSGNGWLGFFAGGLSGAILGVIHAVACIQFGADQTISGTAINFIGPGLAKVGPMANFNIYSYFSKLVLTFDMLAGRLELYPMLLLFSPGVWRIGKDK